METKNLPGGKEEIMTPTPSSPVPAVEAELSNEALLRSLMHAVENDCDDAVDSYSERVLAYRAAVLARMSTPKPSRAAEPDTMGEIAKLMLAVSDAQFDCGAHHRGDPEGYEELSKDAAIAMDALLSAVRTIVTERDDARTRAETAEAQLATRGWQDISTAPKDGTVIWVYAPAYDGLDAITSICAWHEDAGFCIDELRSPTHWQPLNAPTAPATEADL